MKKFPLLQAIIGMEDIESTTEGIHLSEEILQSVEDALSQASSNADRNTELETQLDTANNTIGERDTRITELEEEVSSLRSVAGDESSTIITKTEKEKQDDMDPLVRDLNNTEDTSERLEIMRKYGYGA